MSLYDDASLIMYPSGVKSGKIYSQKPTDGTGDLTFTRASTATRVNPSGLIESVASGVPRIDYLNGCGQLLLEPQRTNNIGQSVLDGTYFTASDLTVTINSTTSPDGLTKGAKLVPNTSNVRHSIYRTSQSISGGRYSVFVKSAGYDWILLTSHSTSAPSSRGQFFNIANGTIGSTNGTLIYPKIEYYGNGWYRCSIAESGSPSSIFTVMVCDADGNETFAGNGTSGVYVWGCQNENGTTLTSYIPTAGSTVTRLADAASVTVPSGTLKITETFGDDTTNVITSIPATYTATVKPIKHVIMSTVL